MSLLFVVGCWLLVACTERSRSVGCLLPVFGIIEAKNRKHQIIIYLRSEWHRHLACE